MIKQLVLIMCGYMGMSCWATPPQLPTPVGGFYKRELPFNTYYESVHTLVDFEDKKMATLEFFLQHIVTNYKRVTLLRLNPEWGVKPRGISLASLGVSSFQCSTNIHCYVVSYADLIWLVTTTKDNYFIDYALIYGSVHQFGRGTDERLESIVARSSTGVVYFCHEYVTKKYEGSQYIGDFGSVYIGKIHDDGHIEVRPYAPPTPGDCLYKDIEK